MRFDQTDEMTRRIQRELKQIEQDKEGEKKQDDAIKRAWTIIANATRQHHAYLEYKGFPDQIWIVHENKLVVPMYRPTLDGKGKYLTGLQLIDEWGGKKFLYGQKTTGAYYRIGYGPINILCEGLATGLSIRKTAASAIQGLFSIWICFSAANIKNVAKYIHSGFVMADHDGSGVGEKVARDIGWNYWLSPNVGEDFNDFCRGVSLFTACQVIKKMAMKHKI